MGNTPNIRFKGFTDDWEQRKFSDVFTGLQNNTLSRSELNYESGTVKNVHYGDVLIKFGDYIDASKEELPFINDDSKVEKFKGSFLHNGDIVIADTAEDETVGKCTEIQGVDDIKLISGLHTIPCRPKEEYGAKFLGYYMNSSAYHAQLIPLMQGIKVTSISKSALQDTNMIIPKSVDEQTIIGEYFSNLDHLITLHQRKCDETKELKKFMLQKMFPKNGEKKPEIRFEGFTDDWEQRKLSEVAEIVGGGTPSTNIPEYWDGNIDWYAPAEINDQIYVDSSERKITKLGLEKSSAKILPADKTVLFTSRAGIGKTAILRRSGATNQGFQSMVLNDETNPYFVFSMSKLIKEEAERVASGSTFAEVSGKMLGNLAFMFPTKKEQDKIGEYFSNLDHLITLHQRKCDEIKEIKKFMLQNMFPQKG